MISGAMAAPARADDAARQCGASDGRRTEWQGIFDSPIDRRRLGAPNLDSRRNDCPRACAANSGATVPFRDSFQKRDSSDCECLPFVKCLNLWRFPFRRIACHNIAACLLLRMLSPNAALGHLHAGDWTDVVKLSGRKAAWGTPAYVDVLSPFVNYSTDPSRAEF